MNTIQREKRTILRKEEAVRTAFSFAGLASFLVFSAISLSTIRSSSPWIVALKSTCWFPLCMFLATITPLFTGILMVAPYAMKVEARKQRWLDEHGLCMQARITQYPVENALVINGRARGRGSSYTRYLNCQAPQAEQPYSFRVSSSALQNLPENSLYPVQFDPDDPTFFAIPDAQAHIIHSAQQKQ